MKLLSFASLFFMAIIHSQTPINQSLKTYTIGKMGNRNSNGLKLISTYNLDFPECSGLENFFNTNQFLSVSDKTNKVYLISNQGSIIKEFPYTGHDVEGVAFDSIKGRIYVAEEKRAEIVELDIEGNEICRNPVDIRIKSIKHGLEGITYNYQNNHLYVVNEKDPPLLMELTTKGELLYSYPLSFAKDYSSVYYDHASNALWILSDESEMLAKCNLKGQIIQKYKTGISKGEGVVVRPEKRLIYIVCDTENKLYVFEY